MRLEGKTAIVTGGANGIGRGIALLLGQMGARIVVNDYGTDAAGEGSDTSHAQRMATELEGLGVTAIANTESVADYEGAGRLVQHALDAFGRIDISIHCAGAAIGSPFLEMDVGLYERVIALQMSQKWYMARHLVPHMIENGWGRIVNTTSHGATGQLGQPAFAAAMGGVVGLTKALATELRGTGVTANCLAPGAATRAHAEARDKFVEMHREGLIDDAMWESYLSTPPPEYVAPIIGWLCTDGADDVSGEVFHAAGGKLGVWSNYEDVHTLYRGDHNDVAPWTIEELDRLVVKQLLTRG